MRAFVAIEVPEHVLDSLTGFQAELAGTGADLKLVERLNLHFTIRFLGEITAQQAAEAQSRLGRLSLKGATVDIRGVGAFPDPHRPRVVWAGVAREHESLVSPIASEVFRTLDGLGERDRRPFQAHITLARVRSLRNSRELGELLQRNSDRPFGAAILSELKLKSSLLTSSGPIYDDLGAYPLG